MEKWMVCLFLFVAIVVGTEAAARTKKDVDRCNQRCADLGFIVRRNKRTTYPSTLTSPTSLGKREAMSPTTAARKKRCVCYDYAGQPILAEEAEKQGGAKLPLDKIKKLVAKRMAVNKK